MLYILSNFQVAITSDSDTSKLLSDLDKNQLSVAIFKLVSLPPALTRSKHKVVDIFPIREGIRLHSRTVNQCKMTVSG